MDEILKELIKTHKQSLFRYQTKMKKAFVLGIGEIPAKPTIDVKIWDYLVFSIRETGKVTYLEYYNEYVRMSLIDHCTKAEFSINKRKSNLVGILS